MDIRKEDLYFCLEEKYGKHKIILKIGLICRVLTEIHQKVHHLVGTE